jgi:PAS domain S-box-containing protein
MVETITQPDPYPFLAGGGELGQLTRQHHWSGTVLGLPAQWPQSLRTVLSFLLNARFPLFLWWGPACIQFYNDAYRHSLDISNKHPDALGQTGADCWQESWPAIRSRIDQVLAGHGTTWDEDRLVSRYRNGQRDDVYGTFSYSPVCDESGRPAGVLATFTETTRAVTNISRLQTAEQLFQNLIHDTSVGILVVDGDDLRVTVVNEACARLMGHQPAALLDRPLFEVIPEDSNLFGSALHTVRQTGQACTLYDQPYDGPVDGQRNKRYLDLICQPYKQPDGTITGVMVHCQDVTSQVLTRQNREATEARFRALIEEAPVPTCLLIGRTLIIEVANPPMIEAWGKGTVVLGKPLASALPELDGQPYLRIFDEVYTTGQSFSSKSSRIELVTNGLRTAYYYDYTIKALRNEAGDVYALMMMAVNVTEEVLARKKLEETEASLRGAIELAELGTWHIDIQTGLLHYSERLREWFGIGQDEVITAERAYQPVQPADRPRVMAAIAHALTEGSDGIYNIEYAVDPAQAGQERVLHILGKAFLDETGKPYRLGGTAQDVTQQRHMQRALEQQVQERTRQLEVVIQDLERSNDNLQQFAYVASHDLQEPLRKIQSFGDMLRHEYADQLGDGAPYLERMQVAAARMSTLIRDLLAFSRIATRQDISTTVALNDIVSLVLTDLELIIAETNAVVDVSPLPTLAGDSLQLQQLFQNLLSNAIKFRKPQAPAHIQIRSHQVSAAELPPTVAPDIRKDTYYRIDVIDDGIGFDTRYVDRIFEVFQRLHGKHEYAGTGIGLAICQKVVANHGGAITATSQPGQGATFSVYLPA